MVSRAKAFVLLMISGVLLTQSGCTTTTRQSQATPRKATVDTASVPQGRRTLEPFAYVMFCTRLPAECADIKGPDSVKLSASSRNELVAVNQSVNRQIFPRNDSKLDKWSLSPQFGDCEDYALTKRHNLIRKGWPASTLRLAIGYTPEGEGHLVLIVRTDEGNLVLDNLNDSVRDWRSTDIRWQTIQSSNPRIWTKV